MRISRLLKQTVFFCCLGLLVNFLTPEKAASEEVFESLKPLERNIRRVDETRLREIDELHKEADRLVIQNKLHQALEIYLEIIFLEPDDDVAYANMGQAYLVLGNHDRAKRAFIQCLNINPSNDTAYFGLKKIADPDGVLLPRERGQESRAEGGI